MSYIFTFLISFAFGQVDLTPTCESGTCASHSLRRQNIPYCTRPEPYRTGTCLSRMIREYSRRPNSSNFLHGISGSEEFKKLNLHHSESEVFHSGKLKDGRTVVSVLSDRYGTYACIVDEGINPKTLKVNPNFNKPNLINKALSRVASNFLMHRPGGTMSASSGISCQKNGEGSISFWNSFIPSMTRLQHPRNFSDRFRSAFNKRSSELNVPEFHQRHTLAECACYDSYNRPLVRMRTEMTRHFEQASSSNSILSGSLD